MCTLLLDLEKLALVLKFNGQNGTCQALQKKRTYTTRTYNVGPEMRLNDFHLTYFCLKNSKLLSKR